MSHTFDKEKVHFNLARLKKGEDVFEIVVDPDLAIEYKKTQEGDISEIMKSDQIFADAKKGMQASSENMEARFETSDTAKIAKIILTQGEIQLSAQYREKMRDEHRKQIVSMIVKNGVDPTNGFPHPQGRIEAAIEESKVKIDVNKSVESQIQDVLKGIRTVLPIKFVVKDIEVIFPAVHASKAYGVVKSIGKIVKEEWKTDGSWLVIVEIPGGIEPEFYDKINSITHGQATAKVIQTR